MFFWQSSLKICQSLKIFCNSSPQVAELSLFLFYYPPSNSRKPKSKKSSSSVTLLTVVVVVTRSPLLIKKCGVEKKRQPIFFLNVVISVLREMSCRTLYVLWSARKRSEKKRKFYGEEEDVSDKKRKMMLREMGIKITSKEEEEKHVSASWRGKKESDKRRRIKGSSHNFLWHLRGRKTLFLTFCLSTAPLLYSQTMTDASAKKLFLKDVFLSRKTA